MQGFPLGGGALGWYAYLLETPAASASVATNTANLGTLIPGMLWDVVEIPQPRPVLNLPRVTADVLIVTTQVQAPRIVEWWMPSVDVPVLAALADVAAPLTVRAGGSAIASVLWQVSARRGLLVRCGAPVEAAVTFGGEAVAGVPDISLLEMALLLARSNEERLMLLACDA